MISTRSQEIVVNNKVVGVTGSSIHIKLVSSIRGDKGSQGHFILGKGTSLVRANCGDRSKSLNSWKGTDNGILLGHVGHSPGISHGDNSFQTFRDHGNSTDKSCGEGINTRFISDEEGNKPSTEGSDGNEKGKPFGDSINLFQDIGLFLFNLAHKSINGTNLSVVTSGNDKASGRSRGNKGSTEAHVVTITKGDSLRVTFTLNGFNSLVNGNSFSSQSSFQGSQVGDFQHTQVSRDTVSQSKLDNISRNNLVSRDLDILSITDKQSIRGKHGLQGISSLFSRTFLHDTNCCVQPDFENKKCVSHFSNLQDAMMLPCFCKSELTQ